MPWSWFLFLELYSPFRDYGGGQGSVPTNLKRCRKIFRYRSPVSILAIYLKRKIWGIPRTTWLDIDLLVRGRHVLWFFRVLNTPIFSSTTNEVKLFAASQWRKWIQTVSFSPIRTVAEIRREACMGLDTGIGRVWCSRGADFQRCPWVQIISFKTRSSNSPESSGYRCCR